MPISAKADICKNKTFGASALHGRRIVSPSESRNVNRAFHGTWTDPKYSHLRPSYVMGSQEWDVRKLAHKNAATQIATTAITIPTSRQERRARRNAIAARPARTSPSGRVMLSAPRQHAQGTTERSPGSNHK